MFTVPSTSVAQTQTCHYPKGSLVIQKAAYLAPCLQPPVEVLNLILQLKLTLSNTHTFGRGQ